MSDDLESPVQRLHTFENVGNIRMYSGELCKPIKHGYKICIKRAYRD
jgi:hypothetical protein